MNIKDALQKYVCNPPSGYGQYLHDKELKDEFKKQSGRKWLKFMLLYLMDFNRLGIKADHATEMCESFGYTDIDKLNNFVDTIQDTDFDPVGFHKFLFPSVPQSWFTKEVTFQMMCFHVCQQTPGYLASQMQPAKVKYRLTPVSRIPALIKACKSDWYRYLKDGERTCSDFTKIFIGWLARIGLGDLTIGEAKVKQFYNGEFNFGHDIIFILDENFQLWFYDGQKDELLWKAQDKPLLRRCDAVEVFNTWI